MNLDNTFFFKDVTVCLQNKGILLMLQKCGFLTRSLYQAGGLVSLELSRGMTLGRLENPEVLTLKAC